MRPASRRLVRPAAVLCAAALAALPLLAAAPAAGTPRVARDRDADALATSMTLTSISPVAPQPGDTLDISGRVLNTSTAPLHKLTLELFYNPEYVGSRGVFDQYAETSDSEDFSSLEPVKATVSVPQADLPAGGSEGWSLSLPLSSLDLPRGWEVYELGVAAISGDTTVGRLRTFLPYAPAHAQDGSPLTVSWVWPIVDRPHREIDGARQVFTDDSLAGSFAPGGRLQRLVQAAESAANPPPPPAPPRSHRHRKHHRPVKKKAPPALRQRAVHVTYAVDPMLIEDAQRMSAVTGYPVRSGTSIKSGTGREAATAWLAHLAGAAHTGDVLALPYADPDVVAAVRHGIGEQVQQASTYGQEIVTRALGTSLVGWDWPPGGVVNESTLETLFAAGITNMVLSGKALPPSQPTAVTPNAHVSVVGRSGGSVTALLADPTLGAVIDSGAQGDSGLALQRYLSETLMIQAEEPSNARSIVIAPNQRWDPSAGYADSLLADTGLAPWLRSSLLPAAARAPVTAPVPRQLAYTRSDQRDELPPGYVGLVGRTATELRNLQSISTRPNAPQEIAYQESLYEALSSSWRDDPIGGYQFTHALQTSVAATLSQVHIASRTRSTVTLTSHSGAVPITVANDLDQPVRVAVHLDAGPRLKVTQDSQGVRTILPHQRVAVDVRATALTSGTFRLKVQLFTPSGHRYGSGVHLFVQSTAYGAVALLITGGALVLLFVMVIYRLVRRGVAARRLAAVDG